MDDTDNPNSLTRKDIQAIEAARLYYQSGQSQHEVAETLGISRPTVSKLLQHATDAGFVRITIHDPRDDQSTLAETLRARYGLSEVRVTASPANGDIHTLRQNIGAAGARLLEALVRDGDSIGVEWSNSIHAMAQALQPQLRRGIEIVQLRDQGAARAERSRNHQHDLPCLSGGRPHPAAASGVRQP